MVRTKKFADEFLKLDKELWPFARYSWYLTLLIIITLLAAVITRDALAFKLFVFVAFVIGGLMLLYNAFLGIQMKFHRISEMYVEILKMSAAERKKLFPKGIFIPAVTKLPGSSFVFRFQSALWSHKLTWIIVALIGIGLIVLGLIVIFSNFTPPPLN